LQLRFSLLLRPPTQHSLSASAVWLRIAGVTGLRVRLWRFRWNFLRFWKRKIFVIWSWTKICPHFCN
jgi:hypothetical protein